MPALRFSGQFAATDRIVHGAVIALMGTMLFGLSVFSLRRGLHRQAVVAALLAYAAGVSSMIGAALIDGFLVPAIAVHYAGAPPDAIRFVRDALTILAMAIQILTGFGVIAVSTAVVLWSADLVRTPGPLRAVGVIGIASAVTAVALLVFTGRLNPHNLGAIVLVEAIWYIAIAVLLVRERV